MPKIATLTLHAGYNEGAILQSMALQKTISELFQKSTVEIFDHRYPCLMEIAYGSPDNQRKLALQDFYDNKLKLSPKRFYSSKTGDSLEYIANRYNAIVIGSDEVWKISYEKRIKGLIKMQTDPYSPAAPNIFWPPKSLKVKKISYAATIGEKTKKSDISRKVKNAITKSASDFKSIGARDQRTIDFLTWLDPDFSAITEWTPDPTFTTDLSELVNTENLKIKLKSYGLNFQQPRALLICGDHEKYNFGISILKSKGFQIVGASDRNRFFDIDLTNKSINPIEWAGMAKHFDLCISDRMHGSIFSMLNGTPLICLDKRMPTDGYQTKNFELMERCGMLDRYASINDKIFEEKFSNLCSSDPKNNWNTEKLINTLQKFRSIGRDYLSKSLAGIEN